MDITIGAMLETIQTLYQQHNQSCFLYLSSEVIKDFSTRPDIADDCYLLASRCIRYCPDLFVPASVFPSLVDCAMIGATIQHRDACRSILTFISDVLDLANSSNGDKYRCIIDSVILPRGTTLTRILIASLSGALPSSIIEEVTYALLALTRSYGTKVVEWGKGIISLIPSSALTEVECARLIKSLSDAASGSHSSFTDILEELSDVCRRNKTVQDIVQGLDLHFRVIF